MVQCLAQSKTNFKARPGCLPAQLYFDYLQGWKCQKLSGQLVPEYVYSHCEDTLPYGLSEFPLLQVVSLASCHFTVHLWEESGSVFSTSSHYVVEDGKKIFP